MAVLSSREVLPRTFSHRFGEPPTAQRKFVATLDGPTPTQEVINAIGIPHGAAHPEFTYLYCVNGEVTETDRWHAEIVISYELPQTGTAAYSSPGSGGGGGGGGSGGGGLDPNPLARADIWTFSTGGAQVPALFYYAGNSIAPLVNSAGDFFENITRPEAELRVTISGNRTSFNYAQAASVTNTLNNATYLGGAPYTWLCAGVTGQQQVEVVNGAEVPYYAIQAELIYRESTHLLFLPDIGFNYLAASEDSDAPPGGGEGADSGDPALSGKTAQSGVTLVHGKVVRQAAGVKKRAWVWHTNNDGTKEKIPSASPVALNTNGSMKAAGAPPNLLVRRVHRVVNFSQYFGTPSF